VSHRRRPDALTLTVLLFSLGTLLTGTAQYLLS
jgi:hypothetical protein